ncbi:hypothetical protein AVEN_118941-1, partial [Araneus ventricosus]
YPTKLPKLFNNISTCFSRNGFKKRITSSVIACGKLSPNFWHLTPSHLTRRNNSAHWTPRTRTLAIIFRLAKCKISRCVCARDTERRSKLLSAPIAQPDHVAKEEFKQKRIFATN